MRTFSRKVLCLIAIFGLTKNIGIHAAKSRGSIDQAFSPGTAYSQLNNRQSHHTTKVDGRADDNILDKKQIPHHDVIDKIRGGQVANTLPNALAGAVFMAVIEKVVKEGLKAANIKFPAALGGCIFLFFSMVLLDLVSPSTAALLFQALTPGAGLLAKWLPVLFVPGLVMLPLSPPIGGTVDIIKVLLTIGAGFVYTAGSTALGVAAVQQLTGKKEAPAPTTNPPSSQKFRKAEEISVAAKPAAPPKLFSDETWKVFWVGSAVSAVLSLAAIKTDFEHSTLLQTIFLTFFTGAAYIWSARLPSAFVKLVHPLVTSSIIILMLIRGWGIITDVEFLVLLRSYKTNKLFPLHKTGAGDLLMYALGPSAVSFGVAVYSRKNLLVANLPAVLTAMMISSAGSLFATAFFVRAIGLGGKNGALIRLSVLARNVTTALSIPLTAMIGGDTSICAAVVCLTGIVGGSYGKALLKAFKITDPLLRGLTIGSSSQGVGVAAMADEPDAFPFGAISMVLTAIAATTLASIPSFQNALIRAASGPTASRAPIPTP